MSAPTMVDLANRTAPVADKKRWTPKKDFKPGGTPGKLHREMGAPEGKTIPAGKLAAAARSSDPEKRRDAIHAETMKKWHHGKSKSPIYVGRKKD